jgi:hypothetical protein
MKKNIAAFLNDKEIAKCRTLPLMALRSSFTSNS